MARPCAHPTVPSAVRWIWRRAFIIAVVSSGLGLNACAGPSPRPDAAGLRAERLVPLTPLRSGQLGSPGVDPTPEVIAQALRADAARLWQRTDAGAGLLVEIERVVWPDGALGCPREGELYTQALVPGWRVTVSDGVSQARYHASRSGYWLECPAQHAQPPLPDAATR